MPSKCCVPGCKSNYYNGPTVPTFGFPNDDFMIKRWLVAIRRKDFTPSKYSRVCELHFKKSDIVTEASAFDPKTGRTLTAPLAIKRLKKGVIPSIIPSAALNSSNRESPSEKRRRLEKEHIKQAVGKSLKNASRKNSQSEISESATISSSRADTDTARNEKQGKLVKNKRKLDNTMPPNKKTSVSNSDITHQQSELGTLTNKNKNSSSLNIDSEATIKEEPPWEEGYGVSESASKRTAENGSLENLYISSVRSISNDNCGEALSSEEESSNKPEEMFDTTFYTKPFSIDERERAFGNFIACELSDLRENLELYTRTKQCIIKALTEAHFEQMSSGKKNTFSAIKSNNVVS